MRLCIYCEHFRIDYEHDWSEVTPGAGFTMSCKNHHFYKSGDDLDNKTHRETLEKGLTCEDYEPANDSN